MLGDSALSDLSAAFYHADADPPGIATKIRGIIGSAEHTGAGQWFFVFRESLPIGEYLASAQNLTGATPVEINVFDGDANHKFLIARVGGVPADINGICAWWSRAFNNGA